MPQILRISTNTSAVEAAFTSSGSRERQETKKKTGIKPLAREEFLNGTDEFLDIFFRIVRLD